MTLENGKNLPNDAEVALVKLFLHSLFSQVNISLNGTLVSTASDMYSYRAHIETLLSYSQDDKQWACPLWPSGLSHWPRCTRARVRSPYGLRLECIPSPAGDRPIGSRACYRIIIIPGQAQRVYLCPL